MINQQCLPFECLQVEIQDIIKNFVDVYQCDADIVITTIYAIVSIAVNKSIKLFDGKYTNYPSMWICHVAPSGSNKSAPVKMLYKPINELNEEAVMAYYEELRNTDRDDGTNKPKPICKKLSLTDTTPEAIYKALSFMPQMIYRDEIKGMIDDFDRYNRSGIISNMLSIWDSTSFCIDRKTEDPTFIREPFLDILGGIQPGLLKSTFGNPQLMVSGFNQRILFVYPDKVPVTYYSDKQLSKSIMPYWTDFIRELLKVEPTELTLSPEAKDFYCTYYNMLQDKKSSADDYMQYVYSKLQIIILRWTIVTHLLWEKTLYLDEEGKPTSQLRAVVNNVSRLSEEEYDYLGEKVTHLRLLPYEYHKELMEAPFRVDTVQSANIVNESLTADEKLLRIFIKITDAYLQLYRTQENSGKYIITKTSSGLNYIDSVPTDLQSELLAANFYRIPDKVQEILQTKLDAFWTFFNHLLTLLSYILHNSMTAQLP